MILGFAGRTHCNMEEAREFDLRISPASVGDVCGNGDPCAPKLSGYTLDFGLGKLTGYLVKSQDQLMSLCPNLQVLKVPQVPPPNIRGKTTVMPQLFHDPVKHFTIFVLFEFSKLCSSAHDGGHR